MTPRDVATVLESSGRAVAGLVKSLPNEISSWRPAPGEWCVNECVGHLIEAERRAFAGRIRIILGAQEPKLEAWDAAEVAATRNDCARPASDLATEFEELRRDSLQLIGSLTDADLERGGLHPKVGRLTVDELLHEWVHHDANHLRQALAGVEAYVWPSMGNTRTFSQG